MLQRSMAMGDWWTQIADLQTLWNTGWANCDSLLPYMWAAGDNSPGILKLRRIYESLPQPLKLWLEPVYIVHSGIHSRLLLATLSRSVLPKWGVSDEFLPALSIQAIGGLHCTRDMWIDEVYVKHWEDILGTGCEGTRNVDISMIIWILFIDYHRGMSALRLRWGGNPSSHV